MGIAFSQLFPPSPKFTENSLASCRDKVYIVTGGASGIGFELTGMLYSAGAKVYIAGRSELHVKEMIAKIVSKHAPSDDKGMLDFLYVDLADLTTIKPAAVRLQKIEKTLDVLFNNAAVSLPPAGSVSAQGHELMMATNVLGHHLLTQLLLPLLRQTPGARVVWTTSQNAELPPVASLWIRFATLALTKFTTTTSRRLGITCSVANLRVKHTCAA